MVKEEISLIDLKAGLPTETLAQSNDFCPMNACPSPHSMASPHLQHWTSREGTLRHCSRRMLDFSAGGQGQGKPSEDRSLTRCRVGDPCWCMAGTRGGEPPKDAQLCPFSGTSHPFPSSAAQTEFTEKKGC